ncbi:MAG: type 1 glutamine amidotransferase [Pirellulales bacterium]
MPPRVRYLLLQTRNADDSMRAQEIRCFARALECEPRDIVAVDFLARGPSASELAAADIVLLGGSGHYSAAGAGAWLDRALDALRELHHQSKPTFASCWGFQAMARALGGRCIHDPECAELGTIELALTDAGRADPLFASLPLEFIAHAGHEDHVIALPADAVLLASSNKVRHQAFRFDGKPIYCTQFHPELDCRAMSERVAAYPEYVERIAAVPHQAFIDSLRETPAANGLLKSFVDLVLTPNEF